MSTARGGVGRRRRGGKTRRRGGKESAGWPGVGRDDRDAVAAPRTCSRAPPPRFSFHLPARHGERRVTSPSCIATSPYRTHDTARVSRAPLSALTHRVRINARMYLYIRNVYERRSVLPAFSREGPVFSLGPVAGSGARSSRDPRETSPIIRFSRGKKKKKRTIYVNFVMYIYIFFVLTLCVFYAFNLTP